ncbi:hypothetical protein GGR56DRAFT_638186 [Xylariaceae sp. FL0804]|nr:hypothetical protein GGR56DRAFT_638186 [Xylariaceae sp. FL0804]
MSPITYTRTAVGPTGSALKNGRGGGAYGGGSGPRKVPFRHIDDLVSVGVDIDPHTPIRKLLEVGDAHMRQATTLHDFHRPDLALQEYIKAFTIAVDKVPRHKDYPSLKSDRGDLNRLYGALKSKITTHGATFDQVKEDIKEDNRRSGVRSASSQPRPSANILENLPSPPAGAPNGTNLQQQNRSNGAASPRSYEIGATPARDGSLSPGRKAKPMVHPKPQALQGHAIKASSGAASQDLTARFAKLRTQDSRGTPDPSRLAGPRDMPVSRQRRPTIDSSMPPMPKLPDAIYSPARGTLTSEAANLPSSTPRGMFSRTSSVASIPSASSRRAMDEQFVAAHALGASQQSAVSGKNIPGGDTITVTELLQYLDLDPAQFQILVIDVRDRESFDEGHIPSQRTICVEPEILARENISADEIAESMVLSPSQEVLAFEQRDKVDMVVFYDDESAALPSKVTGDSQEMNLFNLRQALRYYSYNRQLRATPKLLVGGLDAWMKDPDAPPLVVSDTSNSAGLDGKLPVRGLGKRKRPRTKTRTLGPDEVQHFQELIAESQNAIPFDYAKSREDFDRRFPAVASTPESMSSPVKSVEHDILSSISPKPPSRPPPSVAKTRYSGLESADDALAHAPTAMLAQPSHGNLPGQLPASQPRTGLINPGSWCYAHATIQALLASSPFVDELLSNEWPSSWAPNVKVGDMMHPQLMCKILGNILQWMSKRMLRSLHCKTFMSYLNSIHFGSVEPPHHRFGDRNQHDADEFITFVFGQLAAETHQPIPLPQNFVRRMEGKPRTAANVEDQILDMAQMFRSSTYNIHEKYWYTLEVETRRCTICKNTLALLVQQSTLRTDATCKNIQQWADHNYEREETVELKCEVEGCPGKQAHQGRKILRLPPLLRLGINRNQYDAANKTVCKNTRRVDFALTELLRFGAHLLDARQRQGVEDGLVSIWGKDRVDSGYSRCSTNYEPYAVIVHQGPTATSGHYFSYVRTGVHQWIECNDEDVRVVTNSPAEVTKLEKELVSNSPGGHAIATPYTIFYKRADVPWQWDQKT